MRTSLIFHNDSLNSVWNFNNLLADMIFLPKVSLLDKRADKLYVSLDRHLWDKNCLLSTGSLNKNCKYCWYHGRKQEEGRILLFRFRRNPWNYIRQILSQILSSYKIRIPTIESFLIGIFSSLRNFSILLMEKNVKFSLIKKLLAPCKGVKKKPNFEALYNFIVGIFRTQRAVRVDGGSRALFHLPSVVWASSRSNLIFVETRVRKPPTYIR